MLKKISQLAEDKYFLSAFFLFVSGLFLRLYKLNGFVTFLGDQGRDAIVIKRIVTFEHFPAIGPPTSVGQVYLGPFYYYFISPWLWLFNFNPLGLAFGVALLSSLFILVNYFLVKDLFNRQVALVSTIFVTFSFVLIDFSRFSWNPNLLPFFALFTIYFLLKAFKNLNWKFFALAGAFLSFSIQLHYLALFLVPPVAIYSIIQFFEQKKRLEKILIGGVVAFFSFVIFSLPLIIFDLRHDFLNTHNLLQLLNAPTAIGANKLTNLIESFLAFNQYAFHATSNLIFSSVILVLFVLSLIFVARRKDNLRSLLIFFVISILGSGFYLSAKHPHYFGLLYPLYYLLIAYFLSTLLTSQLGKMVVAIFIASFIFLNYQGYYFFTANENNQIDTAKNIALKISPHVEREQYRLTSIPNWATDYTYRYFLEVSGKKPIEKDSLKRTPSLIVVCETPCEPLKDTQWDISYFAPRKIAQIGQVGSVTIYRLTR